jgi:alkanesulfonate monooxygenase SsuD/methylene tetrahydromethanopterin reductase-like flavin-dependent oxidoreductase (luciferase family)
VRQVAERGYNLLLGQYDMPEHVLGFVAQFRRDVEARGRKFNPMEVGVARAVHFADNQDDLDRALERRYQGHLRVNRLATRPGDDRDRFVHNEAQTRHLCNETAIFGAPDQIARKIDNLRAGGIEYVLINFGGSITNIRRFAREIMPHFAGATRMADAAK